MKVFFPENMRILFTPPTYFNGYQLWRDKRVMDTLNICKYTFLLLIAEVIEIY